MCSLSNHFYTSLVRAALSSSSVFSTNSNNQIQHLCVPGNLLIHFTFLSAVNYDILFSGENYILTRDYLTGTLALSLKMQRDSNSVLSESILSSVQAHNPSRTIAPHFVHDV